MQSSVQGRKQKRKQPGPPKAADDAHDDAVWNEATGTWCASSSVVVSLCYFLLAAYI